MSYSLNHIYLSESEIIPTGKTGTGLLYVANDNLPYYKTSGNTEYALITEATDLSNYYDDSQVYNTGESNARYVSLIDEQTINGAKTFNDPVIMLSGLTVSGVTTFVNTDNLNIKDNLITLNSGETGAGVTLNYAGIEIDRGSLTNYVFLFDEEQNNFRIGETDTPTASTQAVATREDNPTISGISYWNNDLSRFDTKSDYTLNTIYTRTETNNYFLSANTVSNQHIAFGKVDGLTGSSDLMWDGLTVTITGNDSLGLSNILELKDSDTNEIFSINTDGKTTIANQYSLPLDSGTTNQILSVSADTTTYWTDRTLVNLTDVSFTSITSGDLLSYDGDLNKWVNITSENFDLIKFLVETNIDSDGSLVNIIPAKYKITSIVLEETSGYTAGNVSIGIISGGTASGTGATNVIYDTYVGANELVNCGIGTEIFSLTNDTTLYISSDAWGDSQINTHIKIEQWTE